MHLCVELAFRPLPDLLQARSAESRPWTVEWCGELPGGVEAVGDSAVDFLDGFQLPIQAYPPDGPWSWQ